MKQEFDIYTRDIFEPKKIKVRMATASNERASGRLNLQGGLVVTSHFRARNACPARCFPRPWGIGLVAFIA